MIHDNDMIDMSLRIYREGGGRNPCTGPVRHTLSTFNFAYACVMLMNWRGVSAVSQVTKFTLARVEMR